MVFSTQIFLLWFLPLALIGYYAVPMRFRNLWLTVASYTFYSWARPEYAVLLACVTLQSFFATRAMVARPNPTWRKGWLAFSVVVSLGVLALFKYAGMVTGWINAVVGWAGAAQGIPAFDVALPIGISFFTFQALSYSVDVYREDGRPARSLIDYASYIALFPQLIAGPIVRYEWIEPDLSRRTHSWGKAWLGLHFLTMGLAKKVLLADTFALGVPAAFGPEAPTFAAAWLGVLSYTLQIYFDFSGYSDMAVGLGLLLGFRFPKNFDSPYKSASITEFWRRWHLSLSSFLRDYLYIPLGGNQKGASRTYANLMVVMVLGGLWHGAGAVFLIWGLWHGLLLAIERALGDRHPLARLPRPVAVVITTLLAALGWVVFRAENLPMATQIYRAMFTLPVSLEHYALPTFIHPAIFVLVFGGLVFCWIAPNSWEIPHKPRLAIALPQVIAAGLALWGVLAYPESPFLYFQF